MFQTRDIYIQSATGGMEYITFERGSRPAVLLFIPFVLGTGLPTLGPPR